LIFPLPSGSEKQQHLSQAGEESDSLRIRIFPPAAPASEKLTELL
jgi:hypothetical protein